MLTKIIPPAKRDLSSLSLACVPCFRSGAWKYSRYELKTGVRRVMIFNCVNYADKI